MRFCAHNSKPKLHNGELHHACSSSSRCCPSHQRRSPAADRAATRVAEEWNYGPCKLCAAGWCLCFVSMCDLFFCTALHCCAHATQPCSLCADLVRLTMSPADVLSTRTHTDTLQHGDVLSQRRPWLQHSELGSVAAPRVVCPNTTQCEQTPHQATDQSMLWHCRSAPCGRGHSHAPMQLQRTEPPISLCTHAIATH